MSSGKREHARPPGGSAPWITLGGALVVILGAVAVGLRLHRFELPGTDALTALGNGALPPGLHLDEAFNGIAAWHALTSGDFSPFVRIDLGRMPLHIYLTALIYALAGQPLVVGPRLAALFAGLVSVPVFALCAAMMFRPAPGEPRDWASVPLPALAAGVMAVTYWHVNFSRVGLEHTTHVLFASAGMAALAWALQRPSPRRAALAGAAIGVAVYTYPVAYLMPAVGAGAMLLTGWQNRWSLRDWLRVVPAFAGGAIVVLLPLLVFAVREPEWLLSRPEAVAARSFSSISANLARALLGLFWHGDANVTYNLPGRPLLDPVQSVLFVTGLAGGMRRRGIGYTTTLLWLLVMLLPQVLSQAPHFGRAVGAVPPVLMVVALGATDLWRGAAAWLRRAWAPPVLVAGLLAVSAAITARDYFIRWPQTADLWPTFRVAERLEAEAAQTAPSDWAKYVSPVDHRLSTIALITGEASGLRSFNGRVCTVLPPSGQQARYFITEYEDSATPERLEWLLDSGLPTQFYPAGGQPLVRVIDLTGDRPAVAPGDGIAEPGWRVGHVLQPLTVRVAPALARPGEAVAVRLMWQVLGSTASEYTIGLYLLGPDFPDEGSSVASQADTGPCDNSYPTTTWQAGEWVVEDRWLAVPGDAAPGNYVLSLAVYRLADLQRLPVLDASGAARGDLLPLAQVVIAAP